MGIVDRLRQLDDRVGLSAAPPRWHGGDADPPGWARAVASRRVLVALLLGAGVGGLLALFWTLSDPFFELSNLVARLLLLVPVAFFAAALVIASIAERVDLVDRVRRSETPGDG
jgi:hypothetical protein